MYIVNVILFLSLSLALGTSFGQQNPPRPNRTTVAPQSTAVNAPDIKNSVNLLTENVSNVTPVGVAAPSVTAPVIQSTPQGGSAVVDNTPIATSESNPVANALGGSAQGGNATNAIDQRGLVKLNQKDLFTYAPQSTQVDASNHRSQTTVKQAQLSHVIQVTQGFQLPVAPPDKDTACMPPGATTKRDDRVIIESRWFAGVSHVASRVKNEDGKLVHGLYNETWEPFRHLPYERIPIQREGEDSFVVELGVQWRYSKWIGASNAGGHFTGGIAGTKAASVSSGTMVGVTDIITRIDYVGVDCIRNWVAYNLYLGSLPQEARGGKNPSLIKRQVALTQPNKAKEVKLAKNER